MAERKYTVADLRGSVETYLENTLHTSFERATANDMYKAVSTIVNKQLGEKRLAYNRERNRIEQKTSGRKKICYICMEFLMGQSLKNNLYNLSETDIFDALLAQKNMEPEDIYNCEPDAGLGNGGLGRLAACFMDALASGGYDATGYSLCYE